MNKLLVSLRLIKLVYWNSTENTHMVVLVKWKFLYF
jgi:hypothetical protein